jgi:hypothetical protein
VYVFGAVAGRVGCARFGFGLGEKMSERYWITGVQLGLLQVIPEEKERKKLVNKIIREQFVTRVKCDIVDKIKEMMK